MELQKTSFDKLSLEVIKNLPVSDNYKTIINNTGKEFNQFVNNRSITPGIIKEYFKHLKEINSPLTINLKRITLKKIFNNQVGITLQDQTAINVFFSSIKEAKYKADRSVKEYLTYDNVSELMEKATTRTGLIIKFLFFTGCRVSELINIKLRDIKTNGEAEIKVVGKGNKARSVYIRKNFLNALNSEFRGHIYLFETKTGKPFNRRYIYKEINRIGNIRPHILRHSFAMHLLDNNVPINVISKRLGHSSVKVTADYYLHGDIGQKVLDFF
jgi:integrase/recombinase XerD